MSLVASWIILTKVSGFIRDFHTIKKADLQNHRREDISSLLLLCDCQFPERNSHRCLSEIFSRAGSLYHTANRVPRGRGHAGGSLVGQSRGLRAHLALPQPPSRPEAMEAPALGQIHGRWPWGILLMMPPAAVIHTVTRARQRPMSRCLFCTRSHLRRFLVAVRRVTAMTLFSFFLESMDSNIWDSSSCFLLLYVLRWK